MSFLTIVEGKKELPVLKSGGCYDHVSGEYVTGASVVAVEEDVSEVWWMYTEVCDQPEDRKYVKLILTPFKYEHDLDVLAKSMSCTEEELSKVLEEELTVKLTYQDASITMKPVRGVVLDGKTSMPWKYLEIPRNKAYLHPIERTVAMSATYPLGVEVEEACKFIPITDTVDEVWWLYMIHEIDGVLSHMSITPGKHYLSKIDLAKALNLTEEELVEVLNDKLGVKMCYPNGEVLLYAHVGDVVSSKTRRPDKYMLVRDGLKFKTVQGLIE